jgi:hypothetical protein
MAQFVRENGSAEAWRQRDAAIIPDAGAGSRRLDFAGCLGVRPSRRQQQSRDEDSPCNEDSRGTYGQPSYKSCAMIHPTYPMPGEL